MDCLGSGVVVLIILGALAYRVVNGLSAVDFEEEETDRALPLPTGPAAKRTPTNEKVGFGAIRQADPHFDLDAFYARASEMFVAFHDAVERGDLKPARRFVDERYYAELLAELKASPSPAPATSGSLVVEHARAMTATHEAGMDQVRVLITAHRGAGGSEHVQEYWTLIRRQGAITKADLSLYKCPNCGGPTDGDDPTRCAYCGARLADPALDWVVTRIRTD